MNHPNRYAVAQCPTCKTHLDAFGNPAPVHHVAIPASVTPVDPILVCTDYGQEIEVETQLRQSLPVINASVNTPPTPRMPVYHPPTDTQSTTTATPSRTKTGEVPSEWIKSVESDGTIVLTMNPEDLKAEAESV